MAIIIESLADPGRFWVSIDRLKVWPLCAPLKESRSLSGVATFTSVTARLLL